MKNTIETMTTLTVPAQGDKTMKKTKNTFCDWCGARGREGGFTKIDGYEIWLCFVCDPATDKELQAADC